jgi:hypothetical protein
MNAELTEDTLNQLEMEDIIIAEMGQLSLNAMAGTDSGNPLRIRALVHNKVMLILVNSRSSHSFVSYAFVLQVGLHTQSVLPMKVKAPNKDKLTSSQQINNLEWWAQGYTFHTSMSVLDMGAYDAILGYDWLSSHSPMVCYWDFKTLQFQ